MVIKHEDTRFNQIYLTLVGAVVLVCGGVAAVSSECCWSALYVHGSMIYIIPGK